MRREAPPEAPVLCALAAVIQYQNNQYRPEILATELPSMLVTFGHICAVYVPVLAAVLWGTFAVADDPSRSGSAPVPVPGAARFALEISFFALPALGLYLLRAKQFGMIFGAVVVLHYLLSYDRIAWLLGR